MPSHAAPALEELQRIQRTIALNKVDGKLDFEHLWSAAKTRYLARFTSDQLSEINDALVGIDFHAIDVLKLPTGAKDILAALERSVFARKSYWSGAVLASVTSGAVLVFACIFLFLKTPTPREATLTVSASRAEAQTSAPVQPKSNSVGNKALESQSDQSAHYGGNSSRDEQVATFINLAGFLCGQVLDAYRNPDGTITAHCTETRSGKGRAVYRLDLDGPSVERID